MITGFNPQAVIFFILPLSILIAHGLKYILEKWYGLFPENPYARISALLPLSVLFGIMLVPGSLQYIYGYRYNPNIANEFSYTLEIIRENMAEGALYAPENTSFYKILEDSTDIRVVDAVEGDKIACLGKLEKTPEKYTISQIITSPMRENSDIIYVYTVKQGE